MKRILGLMILLAGSFGLGLAQAAEITGAKHASTSVSARSVVASRANPAGKTLEAAHLMEALSLIESGNNDKAVGKAGEVSRYQIMPFVWRSYKGGNPRNHTEARRIAILILNDRIRQFQAKHSRPPTLVETYALWRSPARAMQLRLSAAVRECGVRFSNLVEDSANT